MWICDGPGKGHHFSNFPNMVWEVIVLGPISKNVKPREKTLSGICGFVMVLTRIIIFQIVPNMVWEGIALGTILEKMKPREKPYQEYVDL